MQKPEVRRQVDLEVKSAAPIEGKYGPQWLLEVLPPWSKYPFKSWIDRDPNSDFSIMPGIYTCIVEKGALKDGKSGDADWDWNWKIITFALGGKEDPRGAAYDAGGAPSPVQTNVQPASQRTGTAPQGVSTPVSQIPVYEDQEAIRRRSIERQTSLHRAVEHATNTNQGDVQDVLDIAASFYDWLSGAENTPQEPPVNEPQGTVGQRNEQSGLSALDEEAAAPKALPDAPADMTEAHFMGWCGDHGFAGAQIYEALGKMGIQQWIRDGKSPAQAWQRMKAKYEEGGKAARDE